MKNSNIQKIYISAGDPSGDRHAADIVRVLKKNNSSIVLEGLGGPLMTAEGFHSFLPFEKMNVMGLFEILRHIPFLLKQRKRFIRKIISDQPDILVCVDYSGFNMPLAKKAKKLGIPVVWYIVPKFWAWKREKYTNFLKNYVDTAAVIFPFVVDTYKDVSDNMVFVGNPLVEQNAAAGYSFSRKQSDLKKSDKIRIALTPGSRSSEIENILPLMRDACRLIKKKYPNATFEVSKWPGFERDFFRNILGDDFNLTEDPLEDLYKRSDITLITAGTATLQAALAEIPMLILYRTSLLSVWLYKRMVTGIKHMGLPNIIAQEEIVPELLQDEICPEKVCNVVCNFIEDEEYYGNTINRLKKIKSALGEITPSQKVSEIINEYLKRQV